MLERTKARWLAISAVLTLGCGASSPPAATVEPEPEPVPEPVPEATDAGGPVAVSEEIDAGTRTPVVTLDALLPAEAHVGDPVDSEISGSEHVLSRMRLTDPRRTPIADRLAQEYQARSTPEWESDAARRGEMRARMRLLWESAEIDPAYVHADYVRCALALYGLERGALSDAMARATLVMRDSPSSDLVPIAELVIGVVLEAGGDHAAARSALEQASSDPRVAPYATAVLASIAE
jgi:hypothetical protein